MIETSGGREGGCEEPCYITAYYGMACVAIV